jgi:hypothetical protein
MKIIINRESVCMGDDCLNHQKTYVFKDNATYIDLFETIKNDNYLPSMSNAVWVLTNENYSCIFSYFTKTNKLSMRLSEKSLKTICKGSNKLRFEYHSSPQSWKEHIYHLYSNDEYTMLKDGWYEEIKYCDFLM